jgi:hypothetical protein
MEPSAREFSVRAWVEGAPSCAALSRPARLVLGCLEVLAHPTVAALAEVTGLSRAEIRRCITELRAVGLVC